MSQPSKKLISFTHIVGVLAPIIRNTMYQSDVRNDREKLSVPIDMVADTLGKAWKVTDRELQHQKGNISDKALDFINYQFYLTKTKPVWYEGADNQFRE